MYSVLTKKFPLIHIMALLINGNTFNNLRRNKSGYRFSKVFKDLPTFLMQSLKFTVLPKSHHNYRPIAINQWTILCLKTSPGRSIMIDCGYSHRTIPGSFFSGRSPPFDALHSFSWKFDLVHEEKICQGWAFEKSFQRVGTSTLRVFMAGHFY